MDSQFCALLDAQWCGNGSGSDRQYFGTSSPSGTHGEHADELITLNFVDPCSQYLIMNLGMSENFGVVDLEHLTFPTTMRVDWIRVYQPKDAINIGCDPKDFPTEAYINQ